MSSTFINHIFDETNQAFNFWGILVSGYALKKGVFLRGACFRAAVAGLNSPKLSCLL